MVLETVKDKAFDYLKSKGLTKEDIGRVIGIFFFAKYITFASMIPLCYRYQPIRRFIKPVATREYFIARRNKLQHSRIAQYVRSSPVAATTAKSYQDWIKRNNLGKQRVVEMRKRMQNFMNDRRAKLKTRLDEIAAARLAAPQQSTTWRSRLYAWTEKIAEKASKNERWKNVAKGLKVPPKQLAYAIGEGLVLYKVTSPIWMPIELYGIVKFLQWRKKPRDDGMQGQVRDAK
jgi:hypothetical protein